MICVKAFKCVCSGKQHHRLGGFQKNTWLDTPSVQLQHRIAGAKKYALEGAREGLSIASARANNEGAKAKITS